MAVHVLDLGVGRGESTGCTLGACLLPIINGLGKGCQAVREDGGAVGGALLTASLDGLADITEVPLSPTLGHALFESELDGHQVFFRIIRLHL